MVHLGYQLSQQSIKRLQKLEEKKKKYSLKQQTLQDQRDRNVAEVRQEEKEQE